MSVAEATELELNVELWHSFLSVFRSYALLDKLMSIPMSDGDAKGESVLMAFPGFSAKTGKRFELFFGYTPNRNIGDWTIATMHGLPLTSEELEAATNHFSLNPDGTVRLAGADVPMDHAAIDILQAFKREMDRDEIEVPA